VGDFQLKPRARYFAELSAERRAERKWIAEEAAALARPQPIRFAAMLAEAHLYAIAPHRMDLGDEALMELQKGRCFLCCGRMRAKPTRDHVWPKSHGGTFTGNKLLAHQFCNAKKGNRRPTPCELLYRDAIYEIAATPRRVRETEP
jgi:5-methylcytosine-specific restriction endonuclease McrA